ncbi:MULTISPECIES: 5-dehydro-4-deoxy-D-glucuronate isomerase [unclassified Leeuwenhoekiella]|uniref:5-dehydro-4-deoxy-D-glucuronate isomerase n=1 Tax=unclassified Leeuwenhoekiella TaxID=2615029 RepID=UPI000C5BAA80|nr:MULTISPECIES: 5-dehydro-4-deoxy-D-glucuronate isomerase [unclassified Leeuwenhoekiella]MAW93640.1 5-dehydro-4-deoxy-D-glucuronate isomerase [Leeuwenhoekiella sp.]MBA80383.1 5-dehydro-4-deoxy-D-glucuronate isomerase [Leeuwenhoekiella sp.]|tara:strand:- start:3666 stop:4499 length:834 start_codon:yes stop_codon:yes gene_type:complete
MTKSEFRYAHHPEDVKRYTTQELREHFLIPSIFVKDEINLTYTMYDRYIAGGAFPVSKALKLESIDDLKAEHFLDRRELGVINVGGKGKITVDGEVYELGNKEALYVGKGVKEVIFEATDEQPYFYLNSAPAHHAYPTKKVTKKEAEIVELGDSKYSNKRVINKLLVNSVVDTCQLQMGMTELVDGNVWNTMPAHTHTRRMEVYFYFDLEEGQTISHFMGQPHETRHVFMKNHQAIISPEWSIHSGAGTSNYTFIWGMAGENMDYGDMDGVSPEDLK